MHRSHSTAEQEEKQKQRMRRFQQERIAFFRGMQLYASDEERVRQSAKAFYKASFQHAFGITDQNKDTPEMKALLVRSAVLA